MQHDFVISLIIDGGQIVFIFFAEGIKVYSPDSQG